jgi:hypothetical protein
MSNNACTLLLLTKITPLQLIYWINPPKLFQAWQFIITLPPANQLSRYVTVKMAATDFDPRALSLKLMRSLVPQWSVALFLLVCALTMGKKIMMSRSLWYSDVVSRVCYLVHPLPTKESKGFGVIWEITAWLHLSMYLVIWNDKALTLISH